MNKQRLMTSLVCAGLALLASPPARAQQTPGAAKGLVFIVARPEGDQANAWLGTVGEAYFRYRLLPLNGCSVVSPDTLKALVKGYANYSSSVGTDQYRAAGAKIGATHVVTQTIDATDPQAIEYLMEVVSIKDNATVAEADKSVSLGEFGAALDSCAADIVRKMGIKPSADDTRFLQMTMVSANAENVRLMGDALHSALDGNPEANARAGAALQQMSDRDNRMLLAQFCAQEAYGRGAEYKKASAKAKDLIAIVPGYLPLYAIISRHYLAAKEYGQVAAYFEQGVRRGMTDPVLYKTGATAYEAAGRVTMAEKAYGLVLKSYPDDREAHLFFARESNLRKAHSKALSHADAVLKGAPSDGAALLEKGKAYMALDQHDEAMKVLQKAVKATPDAPDPALLLADLYALKKEWKEAAGLYAKVVELSPALVAAYPKAADAYELAGSPEQALSVLRKMPKEKRNDPAMLRRTGLLEYQTGDRDNAIDHLEKCLSQYGKDGEVLLALGKLYQSKKELDKAAKMYERALPLLKDNKEASAGLGKLYLTQKQPAKALSLLTKVALADPKYPEINHMAGQACLMVGDSARALDYFLKEREAAGGKVPEDIQKEISSLSFRKSPPASAVVEIKKVLDLDPANPTAYYQLAQCYLRMNDVANATRSLNEAAKLGPTDAATHTMLGDEFSKAKAYPRAMEQYAKSLKYDPKQEAVWESLAALQAQGKMDAELAESYMSLYGLSNAKHKDKLALAGHLYLKTGQIKKAEGAYAAFIKNGYSDPDVSVNYSGILFARKKYKDVADLLSPLKPPHSAKDTVISMLGQSSYHRRDLAAAAPLLTKLVANRSTNAAFVAMTAEAADSAGQTSTAVQYYQKQLSLQGIKGNLEVSYRLGTLLEKSAMTSKAIACYEQNTKAFPDDIRSYLRLVELYRKKGDAAGLEGALVRIVKLPKAPPELHKELAGILVKKNAPGQAVVHLEQYLSSARDDTTALLQLATLYYDKKDYKKAIDPLRSSAKLMPRNAVCRAMLGRASKETGDLSGAITAYEEVLGLGKPSEAVLLELADCYRAKKDSTGLAKVLDELVKRTPDDFGLLREYGMLLIAKGDTTRGAATLEKAAVLKPADLGLRMTLAEAYRAMKKPTQRLPHLQRAVALKPTDPKIHQDLAEIYESQGKFVDAARSLDKALSLSGGKNGDLAYHAAELLEKGKMTTEATKKYERNLSLYPKDIRSYVRLIDLYRGPSNATKIEATLKKAVDLPEAPPDFDRRLAEIMLEKKNTSAAILHFEKYVTQVPNDSNALFTLGSIYFANKEYNKAAGPLQSACRLMSGNRKCLEMLAEAQKASGQIDEAIVSLEALRKMGKPSTAQLADLADCYRGKKDATKLTEVLRELAARDPKNFDVLKELGTALLHQGRDNDGAEMLERAVILKPREMDIHLVLARTYQKLKVPAKQIAHLTGALAVKEKDPQVHFELGRLYEDQGNAKLAVGSYQKTVEYDPKHDEARYRFAELLIAAKQYGEAEKQLSAAAKIKPSTALYHQKLAEVFAAQGDFAKARKALDGAIEAEPGNSKHLIVAADFDEKMGDLQGARDMLRMAADKDRSCTECLGRLAILYARTGDHPQVVKAISEIFQKGGYTDTLAMFLGASYTELGEIDKAAETFGRILSTNPGNTEALYRLTHLYAARKETAKAQEVRQKHPVVKETGWTHLLAGEMKEEGNLYDDALRSYMVASKLLPERAEPYAGMARIYMQKKSNDEAIMMVGRAMAYDSENPEYFLLMGTAYEEIKQYDAALGAYQEAAQRDPTNPEAHFYMGRLHSKRKEYSEAVQALMKGISYDRNNPKLNMGLGHVLRVMGRNESAIKAYEIAGNEGGEEYLDAFMFIGMIYYKLLDNENAVKYLKKYRKKGGKNGKVDELLKEIEK